MKQVELEVARRYLTGKGYSKRLRKKGLIPGVLYGLNKPNYLLELSKKNLYKLLKEGKNIIIKLLIREDESKKIENETVILKDIQISPLTHEIQHVDFMRISTQEKITLKVPVVLEGEPKGVSEGGIFNWQCHELEIRGSIPELPEAIKINISNLGIGDILYVSDIKKQFKDLEIKEEDEVVIATIEAAKLAKEEEEEEKSELLKEEEIVEPEVIKKGKKEKEE
jgi:large subunit ribosomal protein L25